MYGGTELCTDDRLHVWRLLCDVFKKTLPIIGAKNVITFSPNSRQDPLCWTAPDAESKCHKIYQAFSTEYSAHSQLRNRLHAYSSHKYVSKSTRVCEERVKLLRPSVCVKSKFIGQTLCLIEQMTSSLYILTMSTFALCHFLSMPS